MVDPASHRQGDADATAIPARMRSDINRIALPVLLTAACCALVAYFRIVAQTSIVSTHFAYVPIVLAGMWWGCKSVLVALFLGFFILGLNALVGVEEPLSADAARIFCFFVVALCVGCVTERARAAQALESRSRRQLDEVQRRLAASERLASVGQLAAGVAHEINNPLGTVLMYSHMLLRDLPDPDPRREDIEMIVHESTRCRDIVRGLLEFARQSRVNKEAVDPVALIDDALTIMRPKALRKGVALQRCIEGKLRMVSLDAAQIKQLLVNLIDNGIDACRDGGEVIVKARRAEDGRCLKVEVADNGHGIPEGYIPKLFTPFFTTKPPGEGTGLGLAIAYGVVKMHSGDISVQSAPGKGSTFSISLPIDDAVEAESGSA